MKKYLSFFRIRFINGLAYRAAAAAGVATQFAWGIMTILLYAAFYREGGGDFPMTFPALASYIWLQQAFLALFMLWFMDNEIFGLITGGNIAYELARPLDLYSVWFVKNLALRFSRAVLRCMPILVFAVFLPAPYGLSAPAGIGAFLCFLLSAALGALVVVGFCMFIYISVFYTMSPIGVRIIALSATELLSGAVVPLPFFSPGLRAAAELLPFASMQNLPLRIYGGDVAGGDLLKGLLLQLFWAVFLIAAGRLWMGKALKRVVVQGG